MIKIGQKLCITKLFNQNLEMMTEGQTVYPLTPPPNTTFYGSLIKLFSHYEHGYGIVENAIFFYPIQGL